MRVPRAGDRLRPMNPVIMVGAGVSGLTAARSISNAGFDVVVLERARGVGGRCATRRIDGQSVDHGAPFLHGHDERFVTAIESMGSVEVVPGWPREIAGRGVPCQPRAFATHETRYAIRDGMTRFPKYLATGLDIRLESDVASVAPSGERLAVQLSDGRAFTSTCVVLAMPIPQAARLWRPLVGASQQLSRTLPLLDLPRCVPCLAAIAVYAGNVAAPDWQAYYPSDSQVLQAAFVDSSKRGAGARLTLVLHARPAFSRERLHDSPDAWAAHMIEEAGRVLGPWAAAPTATQAHRWASARVQTATELSQPLTFEFGRHGLVGLCGDAFDPAGGVEGAYLSGLQMAERIIKWKSAKGETRSATVGG